LSASHRELRAEHPLSSRATEPQLGRNISAKTAFKRDRPMDWKAIFDSGSTQTHEVDIAVRLMLAAALGGVIGLDRQMRDRPAGLRTHMLTAMAAALFTLITFEIFHTVRSLENAPTVDPIRIIEAVTAGVAFLAAGAIIQTRGDVKGLTTGAGMWLAGAIGVTCGAGFYRMAIIATVLAFFVVTVLHEVTKRYFSTGEDEKHR
jgi:putative Mg2+ transporter-C (MgtC) family protein